MTWSKIAENFQFALFSRWVDSVVDKAFNVAYSLANDAAIIFLHLGLFEIASTYHKGGIFLKNTCIFCSLCKLHDFIEFLMN